MSQTTTTKNLKYIVINKNFINYKQTRTTFINNKIKISNCFSRIFNDFNFYVEIIYLGFSFYMKLSLLFKLFSLFYLSHSSVKNLYDFFLIIIIQRFNFKQQYFLFIIYFDKHFAQIILIIL